MSNVFNFLAGMFDAAGKATQPGTRSASSGPSSSGEECTPCSANAYAESVAAQARGLLGAQVERKRRRRGGH